MPCFLFGRLSSGDLVPSSRRYIASSFAPLNPLLRPLHHHHYLTVSAPLRPSSTPHDPPSFLTMADPSDREMSDHEEDMPVRKNGRTSGLTVEEME